MSAGSDYRLGYRADVEGLRAIAILLVIGAHALVPGFGGGFVGVDAFFVLSGFLITGLLIREIAETGRLKFADFYLRRLRRLFPALIAMLLVSSVLAALVLAPMAQMTQALTGISVTAWLSNVHFALSRLDYFAPGNETNIFLHTWSLGVEEQFYLIWPALIYLVLRNRGMKGLGWLRICMISVAVVSLVACWGLTYRSPQLAFYMMPLRAWQFAVGALVWLEFRERSGWLALRRLNGKTAGALGALGLAMLLLAGCLLDSNKPYPGLYAMVPTIGAALAIASGSCGTETFVQRMLSLKVFQAIGRVSYSWYLWHWPVLLLGHALTDFNTAAYRLAYVFVSLLLAIVSYRFIERPIRHQQWWLVHKRAAALCAVVVAVLSITYLLRWYNHAYDVAQRGEQRRIALSQMDAPVIYAMGCDDWYRSDQVKICAFGDAHATHTVLLLGDSIAGQWFPAISQLYERVGWRLLVLTKSSCPMVDHPYFYARIGRIYTECATWRNATLSKIDGIKPDVVIMSSDATPFFSPEEWTDGSIRVMRSLSKAATQVYVLRATPSLPFDGPDCLAEHVSRPRWLPGNGNCNVLVNDAVGDRIYNALEAAASQFENVHVVDLNNEICAANVCHAELNGVIVFRDSKHMTATFVKSLEPELGKKLQADTPRANSSM